MTNPFSEGSRRLNEIADRAHAHLDALGRVMRLLVLCEVFTEPEPGTFGQPFWEDLATNHELSASFDSLME
ncbi:MAG: hypothetical protein ACRDTD_10030 [Pseudonocardiaceae bacterium]